MPFTPNLLIEHLEPNSDQPEEVVDAALDAFDAAITAVVEFFVDSSNALAITQAQLAAANTVQLVHGGSPGPSGTVTITIAAFARGLFVVDNQLAFNASIKVTGQISSIPSVTSGKKGLMYSNGVSATKFIEI